MTADRMERISANMKRELSMILQYEIEDPRINDITITRVDVTRDLRLAKVYYIVSGEGDETPEELEKMKREVKKGLQNSARFIRRELAHKMTLKYTPELSFREDKAEEREESIDRLFEKVEEELGIEPEDTESEEQSDQ